MSGSKKKVNIRKTLDKVYNSYSGIGQELQFLNSVFNYLNKKSSFLAKPGTSKQVLQIVHYAIDSAKNTEIREQKLNEPKKETKPKTTKKTTKTTEDSEVDKNTSKWIKVNDPPTTKMEIDSKEDTKESTDNENVVIDEDTVAPVGNGGKTDVYVWTQTLSQVEVQLDVGIDVRGKQLDIQIRKQHLFVSMKGVEDALIDGDLHGNIVVDDSTWILDQEYGKSTKSLTIILQKEEGMNWWSRVIIGDPEIDTKLIQPENSKLSDLDGETQKTVSEMMFNQRQKLKGLPTSKELKQRDILEKFKAQHPEMDFSNAKFGGGGF